MRKALFRAAFVGVMFHVLWLVSANQETYYDPSYTYNGMDKKDNYVNPLYTLPQSLPDSQNNMSVTPKPYGLQNNGSQQNDDDCVGPWFAEQKKPKDVKESRFMEDLMKLWDSWKKDLQNEPNTAGNCKMVQQLYYLWKIYEETLENKLRDNKLTFYDTVFTKPPYQTGPKDIIYD